MMKVSEAIFFPLLLVSSLATAFSVDEVIEQQNTLEEMLQPYLELQSQFIEQETRKMITTPGYKPDFDHSEVREATIQLVGEMINSREQAMLQARATVKRKACHEAINDYRDTTLSDLKLAYQDYISRKDQIPSIAGNTHLAMANARDAMKLHAGPLYSCGEYYVPLPGS